MEKRNIVIKIIIIIFLLAGIGVAGYYGWQMLFGNRDLEVLEYTPQTIKAINEKELKETFVSAGHSKIMLHALEKDENNIENYEYFLIPDGAVDESYTLDYIYDNIMTLKDKGYSAADTLSILQSLDDQALRFFTAQEPVSSLQFYLSAFEKGFSNEDCLLLANSPGDLCDFVFDGKLTMEALHILLDKAYTGEEAVVLISRLSAEDFSEVLNMKNIPELATLLESGEEFKIDLLPRYLLQMRNKKKEAAEAIKIVNAGDDVIPASKLNYSSFYIDKPTKISNPSSLTAMVNKENYLPSNYEPSDLVYLPSGYYGNNHPMRSVAAKAFVAMADAVKKAGYGGIVAMSNYRDYDHQSRLYQMYKSQDGQAKADQYSARPGFSEHQTGLVTDISAKGGSMDYFHKYEGYKWVLKHAHEYGFIQRYPKNRDFITGYEYESWHFRYVGVKVATIIYNHGWTLEEYKLVYE